MGLERQVTISIEDFTLMAGELMSGMAAVNPGYEKHFKAMVETVSRLETLLFDSDLRETFLKSAREHENSIAESLPFTAADVFEELRKL